MNTENHYQETDLGNISPNPRGEYSDTESYEYLDLVEHQGGSYLCLVELGTTISGIAPEPEKNTEYWQVITIPGGLTPEYVAMHDKVVNLSEQTAADAEETRTAKEAVQSMETNVQQLQEQTAADAASAEASKDAAAGYAQAADTSRQAAETARDDVNAQVTGFDSYVANKTTDATASVEAARIAANAVVIAQQDASVQAVKDRTAEYIASKRQEAEAAIEQKAGDYATDVDADIQAVKDAGAAQIAAVEAAGTAQIDAVNAAGTAQREAINTADQTAKQAVETAGAKQVSDINTAGSNQVAAVQAEGDTQVAAVQDAAEEIVADRAQIAKTVADVETLEGKLSNIGFAIDTDGGLNIVIYDKEEQL